ncbi:Mitochondrial acidic protein MAM33 [Fulvia fulva]|uniref:Mitochondrial acidic protein MAM33 n=1 Tax=Passalora fulva TaxID=5499 RepID=A0A9Q8PJL3_PASFU|nr:Mitochondrial acidic protein MAM33 [Fulvia fulva]KAK4611923.1 Mitochondrial acidic protein MAM33 [Fulvia fulva]KAK4612472.1 Mitochondrial acidic protein MAM33 [Fulvia fulva]UJO23632.1 Mitochondrial acidic protein MAM33 [Fulvia fulva]WPV21479.1 Mitochondrial acidic protein MAM33 [Fulvia fulva]WPV36239.1 Mitochondrial acidic protein MAM33 [Fulvia fulva]
MLALRSLARAAPRTISRIATTSTIRLAFRATSQQLPKIAAFSTTRSRFDEYSQQLSAKLQNEIDIETEESSANSTGSDSNVEAFRAENPAWEIEDSDGKQDVYLSRKYDDETITVHFSIADFNQEMMDDQEEMDTSMGDEEDMDVQSGGANTKGSINQGGTANKNFKVAPEDSIAPADREELRDEEDESGPAFPVDVNVLVQRPGKGALKFSLVASDGDFIHQSLVQLPKDLKASSAQELLKEADKEFYYVPPFQQLDEDLQGLLESYLNARGVTSSLAIFIPDYVDVKEQKEYLRWLGRVKDFLE